MIEIITIWKNTMSKDKDSTTLQEYFISGIVILFFGLLYLFLSNDFNFTSSKGDLLPTSSIAQTTSSSSLTDRLANNDSGKLDSQDNSSNHKVANNSNSQNNENSEQKDPATQANIASSEDAKNNIPSRQIATMDASPEKTQELQQLASANNTNLRQEEPETKQPVEQKKKSSSAKVNSSGAKEESATSQDPDGLIYKLPDGTKVEIAKEGFENNFRKAIENGDVGKPIIFDRVYFDSGSSELKKQSSYQIAATAALLNTYKDIKIAIRGHSDNRGSSKKNSLLSLLRGGSMKKALTDLGIDPNRIQIEGLGDQEPIASNKTKRGRRNNRRIDLVIKK
jgi:outer membrane protein OmpA-like peptidoglycan-associated protein